MRLNYIRSLKEDVIMSELYFLEGISVVHYFGVEGDYNVMVMDILGPSLENLF